MTKIKSVKAREILDSRGNPTIEVICLLESGSLTRASVPSGASTGIHEALELRDLDEERYAGRGVLKAVNNVNIDIAQHIQNKEFDQRTLDQTLIQLDGTENKSRLGANTILGVSMAFARASAKEKNIELYEYLGGLVNNKNFKLPQPILNVINGGKHSDNNLDLQEYLLAPIGFDTFHEKIQAGSRTITALREILKEKGHTTNVGDEGGFAPQLATNEEALELIVNAIEKAGYSFDQIKIGIDVAASGFYDGNMYKLKIAGEDKSLNSRAMIDWYEKLIDKYPILFIEDGLAQDDWGGFSEMMNVLGDKIRIVGDDLTVTNIKRIRIAAQEKAVNSVLIKPNQIGTLTETIESIEMTKKYGWALFISHRSGETTDTFIADLAVGFSGDFFKAGSLTRGERVCKYNRLMEIEDTLGYI